MPMATMRVMAAIRTQAALLESAATRCLRDGCRLLPVTIKQVCPTASGFGNSKSDIPSNQ